MEPRRRTGEPLPDGDGLKPGPPAAAKEPRQLSETERRWLLAQLGRPPDGGRPAQADGEQAPEASVPAPRTEEAAPAPAPESFWRFG